MSRHDGNKAWLILDSGAQFHGVSDPNLQYDFQLHKALLDQHIWSNPILGRGSRQTGKRELLGALCNSGLRVSCVSTSMLCAIGYSVHIHGSGRCFVKDAKTGRVAGKGHLKHSDYCELDYLLIDQERLWLQDEHRDPYIVRFALWLYLSLAQLITSYKKDNAIFTEEDEDELGKLSKTQPRMFGLSRLGRNLKQDENSHYHAYCISDLVAMVINEQRMNHFLLDTGACFHMTWDPSVLQSYPSHLNVKPPIQFISGVSGSKIEVKGVGYIDHADLRLDGVLLVPSAAANLLSLGQLLVQYPAMEGVFDSMKFTFKESSWWWGRKWGKCDRLMESNHFVLNYFRPGHQYIDNLMRSVEQSSGMSEHEMMADQCVPMEE